MFQGMFRFVGKVLNSPIFFQWLTIGFLLFLLVAIADLATDVNVAIDLAHKQQIYSDMLQGNLFILQILTVSVLISKHQIKGRKN